MVMNCMWENNHKLMVPDETVIGHNRNLISHMAFFRGSQGPCACGLWNIDPYRQGRPIVTKPSVERSAY